MNENRQLIQLDSPNKALTTKQIENVYNYSVEIVNNISDKGLEELISAYQGDMDKLINEIVTQTNNIINHNQTSLESEKLEYLEHLEKEMDESLKIQSYNYFKATCLTNFRMQWRNIEWGNLVQLNPWSAYLCQRGSGKSFEFCYAFPLWRLYSYNKPHPLITNTQDNQLRKETCIITNETRLANIHIGKIVEEIKINDILGSKLNPRGKADLAKESIITETGSMLHRRTYGSMIRGLHVGSSITDDFLDKSCLYSKDQRDKFHEVFYAEIKNIIEPNGYNLVSGTPFHVKDLYGDLKEDNMFRVFTYPGIMPNMELLAPDRFTWKYLMDLKKSLGSIVFSREILVTPVSDSSSLFPYEYLNTSKIGMENVRYVDNIDSFPIKLVRVTVGADFAISGNIGADFTVYTVWGVDSNEKYYLLYIWRAQGASHNTQISQLVSLNSKFKPNKIVCESNGFQKILSDMATERGLNNIVPFTTTSGIKKSFYEGLPSLSAIFERGEIKVPWNDDEYTRDTTNLILSEFNSITFNSDSARLESSDQHDDCVMSSFFALTDLRENKVEFSYTEI